ncbi:MAG: M20/M25/M40 family metallo-hydrolase [Planctomycetota bacterium]
MRLIISSSLALFLGLVGCAHHPTPRAIHDITGVRLLRQVEQLTAIGPRPHGDTQQTATTLKHLRETLQGYGLEVQTWKYTTKNFGEVVNLTALKQGLEEPERLIEIGAHYDTVPGSPGADDNSSGVAGVLEIARVLAPLRLQRSVRFCLYGAEEVGLVGSTLHARELDNRQQEFVEGTFILEMIGFSTDAEESQDAPIRIPIIASLPHTGNFVAVVGNFSSGSLGNLYERAADRYVPELRYFSANRIGGFFADAARSDHFPYWELGRKAIMLTDTANFRNHHYHEESDLPETLNPSFMQAVTRAMVGAAIDWARPAAAPASQPTVDTP